MSTLLAPEPHPSSLIPHPSIDDISAKVLGGERLSFEDGVRLVHHPNLTELGMLADFVRQKQNRRIQLW